MRADGDPRHRLPTELAHQACAWSLPKYRSAAAAYSGVTSSSSWTVADPRTSSTLWGQVLSSIVRAAAGLTASAFSLGARGGLPKTNSSPVQWNQIGTTRA